MTYSNHYERARHYVAASPPRDRVPALPAPRAAVSREDTTGSNAPEARGLTDANASFVSAGNRRFPACSHTADCNSFERPRNIRSAVVSTPTFRTGLIHVGMAGSIRTRRVLTTLPDDVRQAARIRRILATSRESVALSNDSNPGQRGDGVASSRASGPEAREQKSRAPRAFSRFLFSRSLI